MTELNLRRMNEYNGYNVAALGLLQAMKLITKEHFTKCMDAVNLLSVTYQQIKAQTTVDKLSGDKIIIVNVHDEYYDNRETVIPPTHATY